MSLYKTNGRPGVLFRKKFQKIDFAEGAGRRWAVAASVTDRGRV